ncbi:MAG: iduronate-2-sulfatase [Roseibacillus sp.]|nr:iduronate-2-sulfatase [Roseibacillus sp.]
MNLLKLTIVLCFFAPNLWAAPNVLFIAVDDLRDWVGHLGGCPGAKTPNIDRLAKRGVSFTRAYCPAPLCNPSRISLMTGVAPYRSGVYGNGEKLRERLPDAVTLMQHFRASGYSVKGAGKVFHGTSAYDRDSWDFFFKQTGTKRNSFKRDPGLPADAWVRWGPLDCGDDEMFDAKNAEWIISEMEKPQEKPFFLAYGLTKPHLDWEVPQKYCDLHPIEGIELPPVKKGDLSDLPVFGKKLARQVYDPSGEKNFAVKPDGDHANVVAHGQWRKAVQAYLATISFADAQIGRVLDSLHRSVHARKTIVVLWGDHGWHLGEKEHWRKHALWEVSTRTPLIFWVPGGAAKGQLCQRPVSLIDIYPTLVELCGLPQRHGMDGQSLKPLLEDPDREWERPVVTTFGFRNHAIRTERWRYIRYSDGGQELYDHEADPNEWSNLASLPRYSSLKSQLAKWLPVTNVKPAKKSSR